MCARTEAWGPKAEPTRIRYPTPCLPHLLTEAQTYPFPMYALALLRYRRPLAEVLTVVDAHRAYLRQLEADGTLIASGPFEPRAGGALLLRVPDDDVNGALDRVRDDDPFVKAGMAQYEMLPWAPVIGKERLDAI